ncbi:MAG TPA: class I SAM-dependent methyltransferase [Nitrospira sp.]|nr:class I SAM-dependent methyltransferase [Nitrospira sp.]
MYTGEPYRVVRCECCGLIRTEQHPSSEAMYVYGGTADAGSRFGSMQCLLRMFRRKRVRQLAGLRAGRALDVGCGDGSFLDSLAERGWDVYGTELSESIAETAKRRFGDRIHIGKLDNATLPEASFDLVTFWHVLEHLDDPRSALHHARRLIRPDGTVIIAVPNIQSLQAQMFKQDWLHLDVPRHRWHFDPHTITHLAQGCGFDVKHVRHFSLEHGPFGIVQGLATKLGGEHVLFTRLLRLSPLRLIRDASFWMHLLLVPFLILPSVFVEALAAMRGRGGCVVLVLKPK